MRREPPTPLAKHAIRQKFVLEVEYEIAAEFFINKEFVMLLDLFSEKTPPPFAEFSENMQLVMLNRFEPKLF